MVVAETFGLPLEAVKVNIGHSTYPVSGASGGSTTVGAVSESHRRAAQDALAKINELTTGASLGANIALVKNNADLAARIAVALAAL